MITKIDKTHTGKLIKLYSSGSFEGDTETLGDPSKITDYCKWSVESTTSSSTTLETSHTRDTSYLSVTLWRNVSFNGEYDVERSSKYVYSSEGNELEFSDADTYYLSDLPEAIIDLLTDAVHMNIGAFIKEMNER